MTKYHSYLKPYAWVLSTPRQAVGKKAQPAGYVAALFNLSLKAETPVYAYVPWGHTGFSPRGGVIVDMKEDVINLDGVLYINRSALDLHHEKPLTSDQRAKIPPRGRVYLLNARCAAKKASLG